LVSRSLQGIKIPALAILLFVVAFIPLGEFAHGAEVFINVERQKGSAVRIAILNFNLRNTENAIPDIEKMGVIAERIVTFDLNFSGHFEIIDNKQMIKDIVDKETKSGKTDWQAWKDLGADAIIYGEYYANQNKEIVVEGRVYDVERKEQIAGTKYTGTPNVFRKMVHRFSDQIVYLFSGERGVAETNLAFTTRIKGFKELAVSDYDGHNVAQLTNDKSIVLFPSWSPSANWILYTTYRKNNPDLYMLDIEKGEHVVISKKIGINTSATWSPDGKKIVFTMSTRGNSDLFSVDFKGKNLTRLTTTRSIETSPTFSPDGKQIAYVSDISGSPQIYIMDADGNKKERFTYIGNYNADPSWSPRGDMIAFSGILDNNFNLHVRRVDGRFEKQLTIYQGSNESPSWSPDGRHIAFTSTRNGTQQIFICNSTGTNQTQITFLNGEAFGPAWAPKTRD